MIIEPFAGAAGYSLRYPQHDVVLVEKYPVIAEMWRYLIDATASDILAIPITDCVDTLPTSLAAGARFLVGFCLNAASASPSRNLSAGLRKARTMRNETLAGWSEARRARVAADVASIKHWRILEGDYTVAPDAEATWFVDPPYNNRAGSWYVHSDIDYDALSDWCVTRRGQVLVCENQGADWLPFEPFKILKAGVNGHGSHEVIYHQVSREGL